MLYIFIPNGLRSYPTVSWSFSMLFLIEKSFEKTRNPARHSLTQP